MMADWQLSGRADHLPVALWEQLGRTVSVSRIGVGAAFLTAAGAIFFVHLPVLSHYFFGDDFVPLADIASRSTPRYIADLFLLRDETPNWRFLTGLFYLATYKTFGLNAFPFLLVSVVVHIGTAGLIFALLRKIMNAVWPAFMAALFFGLTSAAVPTVGQVTAFNNVLGGFLLMLSIALLYEGLDRERLRYWGAASVVSFAAAIGANESIAVLAPVPALIALWHVAQKDDWWRERATLRTLALVSAPYAVIGGAALLAFGVCGCTAAGGSNYGLGSHMIDNLWIYLGRLLYPVGMEPLGEPGLAHLVAGLALAGVSVAALVRGPGLARFAAAFLLLALRLPGVDSVLAAGGSRLFRGGTIRPAADAADTGAAGPRRLRRARAVRVADLEPEPGHRGRVGTVADDGSRAADSISRAARRQHCLRARRAVHRFTPSMPRAARVGRGAVG